MEEEYDRCDNHYKNIWINVISVLLFHFTDYRPIVGYANFCPYSIDDSVTDDFIVDVAKHEIHHALVCL